MQGIAVCRCVSGDWRLFPQQLGANADPLIKSIQSMRAAGVTLIAGTDARVPGATFDEYLGMLGFFTEIGFTNSEVLDMATTDAAATRCLDNAGTLIPGHRADLLVRNDDPTVELDRSREPNRGHDPRPHPNHLNRPRHRPGIGQPTTEVERRG